MIGSCALQVGHHVAEISTRMRAPRCCAASKLAASNALRSAALAADIATHQAKDPASAEMRNSRLCIIFSCCRLGKSSCADERHVVLSESPAARLALDPFAYEVHSRALQSFSLWHRTSVARPIGTLFGRTCPPARRSEARPPCRWQRPAPAAAAPGRGEFPD